MVNINYYKTALNTIYEISVVLNSSANRRHALSGALKLMQDTLSMERAFILLQDSHSQRLVIEATIGIAEPDYSVISYACDEGVVGKVFRLGVPILIPDIHKEPLFLNKLKRPETGERVSFIAVPVNYQGKTYGVLAVDKVVSKMISITTDVEVLKMIANMIASFLNRIDYFESAISAVAEERNQFEAEKLSMLNELKEKFSFKELVGKGKLMQTVYEKINMVTQSSSSVLIRGESGTGKEVVAKTIHYNSSRSDKPFVAVNCAAIPSEFIESELFGYSRGAFSGDSSERKGKFELSEGGTIFLDEVGDMPLDAQSKLLRVLQDKMVDKLGSDKPVKVDVRILAATNKNLEEAVRLGRFRLDLYYRLNVFTIDLPPLRKRKEDIPELCEHILKKLSKAYDKKFVLDPQAVSSIMHCQFPGNIRELENCMERAALSAGSGTIKAEHFACAAGEMCLSKSLCGQQDESDYKITAPAPQAPAELMSDKERLLDALQKAGWVQAKAARMLNMTVRQINYRIQKYNISVKKI
ncbi:MAG: nif-specific transcriptional activator NifA [Deferribacterales bacterium]